MVEDYFSFVAIVASHSFINAQSIDTLNLLHGSAFLNVGKIKNNRCSR